MPSVLIVCEYPTVAGGEQSMLATIQYVQNSGFDIAILAPGHGELAKELRTAGVAHLPWGAMAETGLGKDRRAKYQARLAEVIHSLKPDIVHANSLSMGRIAGPVVEELEVASIAHLRDIIRLSAQAIRDLTCHRRLLAVSQATRTFHIQQGLSPEKTQVLYNGICLHSFKPSPPTEYLHRELHLPQEAVLVATIGQIGLRKGMDTVLNAAKKWMPNFPNAHLLVVGSRFSQKEESIQYESRLHQQASHAMLSGKIHFLGQRSDISSLLNEVQVLVHAPRQEPLGRVLLEAGACAKAIVATHVGGTPEIFPPCDESALLVPVDNAMKLAEGVSSLLGNMPNRLALGKAARRRMESAFDIQTASSNLVAHYQEIIG